MHLSIDDINSLIETQLAVWPEAKTNFDRLMEVKRKPLQIGDFYAAAQLNPARIKSTAAAVDKDSVANRPCFLCSTNRPAQQISCEWLPGWDLLVNPYPILPVHFTIAATRHTPQNEVPIEMAAMVEKAPDLVFFYNGASAGASAPDHLHCQAVLKSELPIIHLVEENHPIDIHKWISSEEFGLNLPFHFLSAVISPDNVGLKNLARVTSIYGIDKQNGEHSTDLVNVFFWVSTFGLLRIVVIPRIAHRPSHYFRQDGSFIVSPGAIDMAGLLILPRADDFERISPEIAGEIYVETAFAALPPELLNMIR